MIVFPLAATVISLACAVVIAADAQRRPRPDKITWAIAFGIFAVAAGAEVIGSIAGWTAPLVRLYYLAGPVLVVGYLALGELYLLAARRVARVGPGIALLVTALAVTLVLAAPVDEARLADDGWEALARGPALTTLTVTLNAGGTVVLVGGALWSAWRFWRRRIQRHRMIGCLLIAGGTLVVASGGTLARLGQRELLYVPMAIGVAIIFAGYLETRRSDAPRADARTTLVPLPTVPGRRPVTPGGADPAIAFLETRVLPLADAALAETCRAWSVERSAAEHLSREEARQVWALRLRLSPAGQAALDGHSVPAQRQVATLYHEVLAPGVAELAAGG